MQHTVAHKAVAHTDQHTDLANPAAQVHHRGDHLIRGFLTADIFQQLHDIGRAEEMHAHDIFRTLREAGDTIHVQRGCIGGENGTGLAHPIQFAEHGFFHIHVLEHGFNHQVHITQIIVAQGGLNQRHALFHLLIGDTAFFGGVFVVLANHRHTALQRVFLHFQKAHRNAGIGKVHGDTATHGTGTDHRHLIDLTFGGVLVQTWHLGHFTLGKEHMTLGRRFRGHQQFEEQLTLALHAFVERQLHRRFHRLDAREWRLETALFTGDGLLELVEQTVLRIRHSQITEFSQGGVIGQQLTGIRQRAVQQITADHLINQPQRQGLFGFHRVTPDDHFQRFLRAHQARQTLGTAGTG